MKEFIPGLKLSELFYTEAAKPILETHFPDVPYSAGLLGWGSEVLGYDDVQSSDHHWGPRFLLFLSPEDHQNFKTAIAKALSDTLPHRFRGYATNFGEPDHVGVRLPKQTETGPVNHMILIETVESFFRWYLGCNPYQSLTAADWLCFSEHKLLAVTSGQVFHDGLGELEAARRKFQYYPRDIWLYLLAAQWLKVFEEREFVSRCGDVGDELGSMVIAARQVKNLMRLCFLMEQRYAPYSKWFGKAFTGLQCGAELSPIFKDVLLASTWKEREGQLARAYAVVARLHNALRITPPIAEAVSNYYARPYLVLDAPTLVEDILRNITDEEVKAIKHLLGSVNQFVDSTNEVSRNSIAQMFKAIYSATDLHGSKRIKH